LTIGCFSIITSFSFLSETFKLLLAFIDPTTEVREDKTTGAVIFFPKDFFFFEIRLWWSWGTGLVFLLSMERVIGVGTAFVNGVDNSGTFGVDDGVANGVGIELDNGVAIALTYGVTDGVTFGVGIATAVFGFCITFEIFLLLSIEIGSSLITSWLSTVIVIFLSPTTFLLSILGDGKDALFILLFKILALPLCSSFGDIGIFISKDLLYSCCGDFDILSKVMPSLLKVHFIEVLSFGVGKELTKSFDWTDGVAPTFNNGTSSVLTG